MKLLVALTTIYSVNFVLGQVLKPAHWMEGKHGIGFRIPGGVNYETAMYDPSTLAQQLKNEIPEISWVLWGLSSGAYGDRYNSPHSILTDLNRASTPRQTEGLELPGWIQVNGWFNNFTIEDYPHRDLFSEMATAFRAEGFKIVAYMAAQGPTFLKHDETRAYDYDNESIFVNSTYDCAVLTNNEITDGKCSPSARRWKQYVRDHPDYGNDDDVTLQRAYAELIVREYARKFNGVNGPLIDGWWFDQGTYANFALIHEVIVAENPNAAIAFNRGQKIPLTYNSPPYEGFTAGHPNPIKNTPPYDDINLPIIESVENTADGYFESNGSFSLAHVFQMTSTAWNNGDIAWGGDNLPKAVDWMSRVLNANGAWTWNIVRDIPSAGLMRTHDIELLKQIYSNLTLTNLSPSPQPSVACTESATEPFYIPDINSKKSCAWVKNKPKRIDYTCSIPQVAQNCCHACAAWSCPLGCDNKSSEKFHIAELNVTRSCAWAVKNKLRKYSRCAIPTVKENCCKTCCMNEPSSMPSSLPSVAPSFVPSLSVSPSLQPTVTSNPTSSINPTLQPSGSQQPSLNPTSPPSTIPSSSAKPTTTISSHPSTSKNPSQQPSSSAKPTISNQPSRQPTSPTGCAQRKKNLFVMKVRNNGMATIADCQYLEQIQTANATQAQEICSGTSSVFFHGLLPASHVCRSTCGTCNDQITTIPPTTSPAPSYSSCSETSNSLFVKRKKTFRIAIVTTCKWLKARHDSGNFMGAVNSICRSDAITFRSIKNAAHACCSTCNT